MGHLPHLFSSPPRSGQRQPKLKTTAHECRMLKCLCGSQRVSLTADRSHSEYFHHGNWLTTQVNVFLQTQWLNVYRTPMKKPLSMLFEGAVTYMFSIKLFCCCCYCFFWKNNKLSPMQYTSAFEVLFLLIVSSLIVFFPFSSYHFPTVFFPSPPPPFSQ